jgi:aryl-alcohol dehydrogenase-like predicted oxidoreductase
MEDAMRQQLLGTLSTSAIGLGCMSMSGIYGPTDDAEAIATIHRAIELGVTLLDTAEMYGPFTNEALVGRAIKGRREKVIIATKFGIRLERSAAAIDRVLDSSPTNVRRSVDASLARIGTDYIDLYYQHRVDPGIPIEDTIGALADLIQAGKIRHIGLSEVGVRNLRRAVSVHPVAAVQSEYSLWTRDVEAEVLPACRELGVGFVAYSPLGRGFLTGNINSIATLDANDLRRHGPRFQGENLAHNLSLVEKVRQLAREKSCTPAQLAIGWVLSRDVVPIPGSEKRTYLEENLKSLELVLTAEDLERIDSELPVAKGDRMDALGMLAVDNT